MNLEEQKSFLDGLDKGDVFVAESIHDKDEFRMVGWNGEIGQNEHGLFVKETRVVLKTKEIEVYMVSDVWLLDDDLRKSTGTESVLFRLLKIHGKF